jgi:CHASE2 domain-containing sensor protein
VGDNRGRVPEYARIQVLAWPCAVGAISALMIYDLGINDTQDVIMAILWGMVLLIWFSKGLCSGLDVDVVGRRLSYRGLIRTRTMSWDDVVEFCFIDGINWLSLGSVVALRLRSGRRVPLVCLGQLAEKRHRAFLRDLSASFGGSWDTGRPLV